MLPPDYVSRIADDVLEAYETYQTSLVQDMAKRLVRLGATETSLWQLQMYQEAGGVFQDAMRQISAVTGTVEKELTQAFEEAGAKAIAYDNRVYEAAGLHPISLRFSATALQALTAGLQKTSEQMHNLTLTTATTSQQAFIQASNRAYMRVVNGGASYTQAIMDEVRVLAGGDSFVRYPSGHRDRIDVAVRRNVLTGVNQTCAQVSLGNITLLGVDHAETTAHFGARTGNGTANHQGWQGRVFQVSTGAFRAETGLGEGDGLCGWNCRHSFYPFIEGVSTPNYSADDLRQMKEASVSYNGEEIGWYDATQMQRSMERDIRATKRELSVYQSLESIASGPEEAGILKQMYQEDAVKLKKQRSALENFLDQTGLIAQKEREQVAGFGRSEASKAVWGAKRSEQARKVAEASYAELVGIRTSAGLSISGLSDHIIDQARERGVEAKNALKALRSPLKVDKIKTDRYGRSSQKYIGEKASVVVNPDTGVAVTVHGTHSKLAERLKRREGAD